MRGQTLLCIAALLALAGCGDSATDEPPATPTSTMSPAGPITPGDENDAAAPVPERPAGQPDNGSAEQVGTPAEAQGPADAAAAPAAGTERVEAQAGVGIKGRSLDGYQGPTVTPARAYFSARERIAFDAAVPKALQLYEATNGEAPKSHEQFMTQVIEANSVQLPDLPQGQRYVYDPQTKELMVERPQR